MEIAIIVTLGMLVIVGLYISITYFREKKKFKKDFKKANLYDILLK